MLLDEYKDTLIKITNIIMWVKGAPVYHHDREQ